MSTKNTAKYSLMNRGLLLGILLFAVSCFIFKEQVSSAVSSVFQNGQQTDFIADYQFAEFHFRDQLGSDFSDN